MTMYCTENRYYHVDISTRNPRVSIRLDFSRYSIHLFPIVYITFKSFHFLAFTISISNVLFKAEKDQIYLCFHCTWTFKLTICFWSIFYKVETFQFYHQRVHSQVSFFSSRATVTNHKVTWDSVFTFDLNLVVSKMGYLKPFEMIFSVKQVQTYFNRKSMVEIHQKSLELLQYV
jgi:hypothetical protein